jgi:hypothetical protein
MSRLLWFRGCGFLPRRWRKFAWVTGLVRGVGCDLVLALRGVVGVRWNGAGRDNLDFCRVLAFCDWPCIGLSGVGSVSVGAGLSVCLACGCALARTNLRVGEKQSTSLRKPSLQQRTWLVGQMQP